MKYSVRSSRILGTLAALMRITPDSRVGPAS
jgi:hypothetical protein